MIERQSDRGWIKMEHEERSEPRRHLVTYPEVIDTRSGETLGRVVDVSGRGLRLIGREPVCSGGRFNLKMVLPGNPSGYDEIRFCAEPVWSGKDINPDYRDTGFRLTAIDRPNRQKLAWLFRRTSFRN